VKKILGLTISAILIIGLVAVGTFAYFSDTETSTGNTITAGTLNLTAGVAGSVGTLLNGAAVPGQGADGVNTYLVIADAKPGDTGTVTFTLTNTGSLAGILTVVSTGTSDENTIWEPEAVAGDVSDGVGNGEMGLAVQFSGTNAGTPIDLNGITDGGQIFTLAKLVTYLNAQSVALTKAGGATPSVVYVITWNIPGGIEGSGSDIIGAGPDGYFDTTGDNTLVDDNVIQSDILNLGLIFTLTQT
jgi:predicted ribosomally synthesized peptide with SipW-like signal peptide